MDEQVRRIIEQLGLQPHPEGGYFRETYRSDELLPPAGGQSDPLGRYEGVRCLGTAILYLLTPGNFSAMHRLASDEVFHFYGGDPVTMLQLPPGEDGRTVTLGPDIAGGQEVQVVVPRGVWQGSMLNAGGRYALLGTTVCPGFEFADFELGDAEDLCWQYPPHADLIRRLTRR